MIKGIKIVTVTFNDQSKAEITFRENGVLDVKLSTGNTACIIRKNKKGIGARITGNVLSREEEEELKKIQEFLN